MNKIEKLLQKLDPKTRKRIEQILVQLLSGKLQDLDIKKIKGSSNVYRVRAGNYRIIFRQTGKDIALLGVSKRDEKTYKDY